MAKRRKKGDGYWGEKIINGHKYKIFKTSYNGIPKSFYGKTEKEVREKKDLFESDNSIKISTNISKEVFGEYIMYWLENVKKNEIKRKTYDGYISDIRLYILPYRIAKTQVGVIDDRMLQDYINELATKYSRSTISKANTLINQSLNYAKTRHDIAENPMLVVTIPNESVVAVKKKEIKFLALEDMNKLFEESKRINEKGFNFGGKIGEYVYGNNRLAIIIIMYTGLRIGELLSLTWNDVDLDKKFININSSSSLVRTQNTNALTKYERIDDTVKTKSGIRHIPLSNRAIYAFKEYEKSNPNYNKNDKVVVNINGVTSSGGNITRTLNSMQVRAKCEVEKCGLHALRHSFGSYLISKGIDIKVVSELLGHKDITTTYNIYIHIIRKQKADAIDIFDKIDFDDDDL